MAKSWVAAKNDFLQSFFRKKKKKLKKNLKRGKKKKKRKKTKIKMQPQNRFIFSVAVSHAHILLVFITAMWHDLDLTIQQMTFFVFFFKSICSDNLKII